MKTKGTWGASVALVFLVACGTTVEAPDAGTTTGGTVFADVDGGGSATSPDAESPLVDVPTPDTGGPADCEAGQKRCSGEGQVQECDGGAWRTTTACPAAEVCADGECVAPAGLCAPGEVRGCASETERLVCDAAGAAYAPEPCPPEQYCLQGECGDELCRPGSTMCDGLTTVLECNETADGWGNPRSCGEGSVCKDGACVSGCEAAIKLSSYIGCEYWTVDLDNYHDPATWPKPDEVPHSVVLSNPGLVEATIQFKTMNGGTIDFPDPIVPPGSVKAFTMPRMDVDGNGIFPLGVQILSSFPVGAYQFNPLNNEQVFSNDGSLLLPASTLGRRYIVASWPSGVEFGMEGFEFPAQHGYFTVVAVQPGTTTVQVTVTGDVREAEGVPEIETGASATFELEQFEVLNLEAAPAEILAFTVHDLTGSVVEADKPVAVFGGHEEAVVAYKEGDSCCADHLEQQLLPVQVWTDEILCAKVRPRGVGEQDIWRIFSAADGNALTTVPPIEGLDGITLDYAGWVEVQSEHSFQLRGTGPVMAVQYTVSQQQTDDYVGDPAMIVSVPVGQYRSQYTILVPEGYTQNWVTVIRPATLQVKVDGVPTAVPFAPMADGEWEVGYVGLEPGIHEVFAAYPFGLIAFGWDNAVSYGYPAGLNLRAADWAPEY